MTALASRAVPADRRGCGGWRTWVTRGRGRTPATGSLVWPMPAFWLPPSRNYWRWPGARAGSPKTPRSTWRPTCTMPAWKGCRSWGSAPGRIGVLPVAAACDPGGGRAEFRCRALRFRAGICDRPAHQPCLPARWHKDRYLSAAPPSGSEPERMSAGLHWKLKRLPGQDPPYHLDAVDVHRPAAARLASQQQRRGRHSRAPQWLCLCRRQKKILAPIQCARRDGHASLRCERSDSRSRPGPACSGTRR